LAREATDTNTTTPLVFEFEETGVRTAKNQIPYTSHRGAQ